MSRDYSKRASGKRASKKKRGRVWLWWLLGGAVLGIGTLIGYGSYLLKQEQPPPATAAAPVHKPAIAKQAAPGKDGGKPGGQTPPQAAQALPQTQYDFYTILPKMEVRPPETSGGRAATPAERYRYFMQAGSFRRTSDAEAMKAQLALLGIQSTVQHSETQNGVWYRVRLGPYNEWAPVRHNSYLLRRNKIDFTIQKVKE
ncbi:MAG: SPOR domain-containing protein [Gammaproteobacteria bacterium]|nr:SPOR domain-containing protein [Gammaproteobacteria bacterium]